jgi:acyl-CoA reductase-like NAD-dependent aldehyde dehydrogenase
VIKTSEKSPLASAHIGSLVLEAGFPPGVINIIAGLGHIAGQGKYPHTWIVVEGLKLSLSFVAAAIAEHMRIRMVTFTGSCVYFL